MNYSKFSNWVLKQIKSSRRFNSVVTAYLIFLMASSRTHTLTAAARFSGSSKSRFHSFVNQLLTQVKGAQRLKDYIQKALNFL